MKRLIPLILLCCFAGSLIGQDTSKVKEKINVLTFLTEIASWTIESEQPGPEFVVVEEGGYTCEEKKAFFRYAFFPGGRDSTEEGIKYVIASKAFKMIDSFTVTKAGLGSLFFLVTEHQVQDSMGKSTAMVHMMTSRQMTDQVYVLISGYYDMAFDKDLRDKFIRYAFSIRKEE